MSKEQYNKIGLCLQCSESINHNQSINQSYLEWPKWHSRVDADVTSSGSEFWTIGSATGRTFGL